MLDTLRKVKGAVATKDFVPVMTHFYIYEGRIQALDGRLAIDAPLPELPGVTAAIPAEKLIKAVDACTAEPTITIKDGVMMLKQGRLKVRLPVQPSEAFPKKDPDLHTADFATIGLLPMLRKIRPFIATDETRRWATGALLMPSGEAYATNNVSMLRVECPMLTALQVPINLPGHAIDELLRIGEEPISFGLSATSVTFYFHGDWWLTCQLINNSWPLETIAKLFADFPADLPPLPPGAFEALKTVASFAENPKLKAVELGNGAISTPEGQQSAAFEGFDFAPGLFNADYLQLVFEIATSFGGGEPSKFAGEGFTGLIIGMRR